MEGFVSATLIFISLYIINSTTNIDFTPAQYEFAQESCKSFGGLESMDRKTYLTNKQKIKCKNKTEIEQIRFKEK